MLVTGLDNGFVCKNLTEKEIPGFVKLPWSQEGVVEIAYWRKAWGLRDEILEVLHCDNDAYQIKVDREDIPAILKEIKEFFHESYFIDNARTIWEGRFGNIKIS